MRSLIGMLALACAAGTTRAQESTFIDLTGVQFKNATNQSRTSAGTITSSCYYDFAIDGMVKGTSGVLQILYPSPVPLSQVLESLSPGSSAFLSGRAVNPGGAHPVVFFNQPLSGTQVISGVTVTFSADFEVGIHADNHAYFNLSNVVISPSFIVGSAQFTSGRADISRFVCTVDYNCDGFITQPLRQPGPLRRPERRRLHRLRRLPRVPQRVRRGLLKRGTEPRP